ncbi:MAG: FliO/MopB family protein [Phycisphaerae bacterium]
MRGVPRQRVCRAVAWYGPVSVLVLCTAIASGVERAGPDTGRGATAADSASASKRTLATDQVSAPGRVAQADAVRGPAPDHPSEPSDVTSNQGVSLEPGINERGRASAGAVVTRAVPAVTAADVASSVGVDVPPGVRRRQGDVDAAPLDQTRDRAAERGFGGAREGVSEAPRGPLADGVTPYDSGITPAASGVALRVNGAVPSASGVVPHEDAGQGGGEDALKLRKRGPGATTLTHRSRGVSGWLRQGLVPLAMVLASVGAVYWAVRRWMPSARTAESGVLRVVARSSIGPKQQVVLMQVGRRFVLVGAGGDRIEALAEIDDPEEVAELAARTGGTLGMGVAAFDDALMREVSGYGDVDDDIAEADAGGRRGAARAPQPLNRLLSRLRGLRT